VNDPRIVIVDVRNGNVYADGRNIDAPVAGQEALLRAIETADIVVEIGVDGAWVKQGVDRSIATLVRTKPEAQMSAEKAEQEKNNRVGDGREYPIEASDDTDDPLRSHDPFQDDPVTVKFPRVWDGV
jgi:hypothetical protein